MGEVIANETLKSLEQDLCGEEGDFIRINRNALVKKEKITGLKKQQIMESNSIDDIKKQVPNYHQGKRQSGENNEVDIVVAVLEDETLLAISRRHLPTIRRFIRSQ